MLLTTNVEHSTTGQKLETTQTTLSASTTEPLISKSDESPTKLYEISNTRITTDSSTTETVQTSESVSTSQPVSTNQQIKTTEQVTPESNTSVLTSTEESFTTESTTNILSTTELSSVQTTLMQTTDKTIISLDSSVSPTLTVNEKKTI